MAKNTEKRPSIRLARVLKGMDDYEALSDSLKSAISLPIYNMATKVARDKSKITMVAETLRPVVMARALKIIKDSRG